MKRYLLFSFYLKMLICHLFYFNNAYGLRGAARINSNAPSGVQPRAIARNEPQRVRPLIGFRELQGIMRFYFIGRDQGGRQGRTIPHEVERAVIVPGENYRAGAQNIRRAVIRAQLSRNLIETVRLNRPARVIRLLQLGADVNTRLPDGRPLLHLALERRYVLCITILTNPTNFVPDYYERRV